MSKKSYSKLNINTVFELKQDNLRQITIDAKEGKIE